MDTPAPNGKFHGTTMRIRYLLGSICLGLVLCYACSPGEGQSERANIILIVADDLGWTDLGVMGSSYYRTPNIDRLAEDGLLFSNAYANAPNCAPSRASLITGKYTPRHGIFTVASAERGSSVHRKLIPTPNTTTLDTAFVTVAEVLQTRGYATGHFGKWHLGHTGAQPEDQGFEVNVGVGPAGHPASYFFPYERSEAQLRAARLDGKEGDYLTDRLTDEALRWLRRHADQPFFLYLPHFAVHTPIQAPDSLVALYENRQADSLHNHAEYAAMIHSLDRSVGRVLAAVDSLGIAGNTTVIFFSDNGGHGAITGNYPLRGAKGMLYEGGIRVPLIVRSPEVSAPGTATETPAIGLDLYATLIELASGDPDAWENDGISLLPLFRGEDSPDREAIFWHFPAYLEAYRGGLSDTPWRTTPASAIRMGNWKLIEYFEDGDPELYNLEDDLGETTDLSEERPEIVQRLHDRLVEWRQATDAPVPDTPNPDYDPDHPGNERR